MAEEDSSQEKTEEPTQKKLDKAKEDGQVPRSKELNTLLVLVAGSAGMLVFGDLFYQSGINIFQKNMMFSRDILYDTNQMGLHLYRSAADVALMIMPFFIVVLMAAFAWCENNGGASSFLGNVP